MLKSVRGYRAPWKGQLVLACRKCQKKLKRSGKKNWLAKLTKTLRKRARQNGDELRLHIIDVSCLKLCPKDGITLCTQAQIARQECSIVRTKADVDSLLDQFKVQTSQHSMTFNAKPASEVSL
jgi:hypothetical protein